MFGQNPKRSITNDPTHLAVESIFYTLQGEGPFAGEPALFIRLAGCNLACHFCDTQFETQAENLRAIPDIIGDIEDRFTKKERRLVVMTGGEPMRQNWSRLADGLLGLGTQVIQVETAGTLWQPDLDRLLPAIHFVCSPKTPSVHPRIVDSCRDWKFIIRAGEVDFDDGLPNRGTQLATLNLPQRLYRPSTFGSMVLGKYNRVWLSPCDDYDVDKNKANLELAAALCMKHGYRLTLQMHKLAGLE